MYTFRLIAERGGNALALMILVDMQTIQITDCVYVATPTMQPSSTATTVSCSRKERSHAARSTCPVAKTCSCAMVQSRALTL